MANKLKEIASRVVLKHDIETNWNRAETFVPKQGEIIIYDIDDNHAYERFKIGDGVTTAINLPFYLENQLNSKINTSGGAFSGKVSTTAYSNSNGGLTTPQFRNIAIASSTSQVTGAIVGDIIFIS